MRGRSVGLVVAAALAIGIGAGFWLGGRGTVTPSQPDGEQKALYWYDPMYPQQHFPAPGKSPFMDMPLVPKYSDDANDKGSSRFRSRLGSSKISGFDWQR